MNLNNLKIGARLAIGFGAVLALAVVIFVIAYTRFGGVLGDMQRTQEYERRAGVMANWEAKTELNISRAVAIVKSGGQPAVDAYFAPQMKATSAQISVLQKDLEQTITSDQGRALLAEIGARRKAYLAVRAQITNPGRKADPQATETLLTNDMLPAAAAYLAAMDAMRAFVDQRAADEVAQTGAAIDTAKAANLYASHPADLLAWTDGQALIATGSPFGTIRFGEVYHTIAQANNALIFPGLGLGVSVVRATRVSDEMIYAAAASLAGLVNEYRPGASLLPSMNDLRLVSSTVAMGVAKTAEEQGLARTPLDNPIGAIYERMWKPDYPRLDVLAVDWSGDGQRLLTGCIDGTVAVWSARSGEPVGRPMIHPAAARWRCF